MLTFPYYWVIKVFFFFFRKYDKFAKIKSAIKDIFGSDDESFLDEYSRYNVFHVALLSLICI